MSWERNMKEGTNILQTFFQTAFCLYFCCDAARAILKGVVQAETVCGVRDGGRLWCIRWDYSERGIHGRRVRLQERVTDVTIVTLSPGDVCVT